MCLALEEMRMDSRIEGIREGEIKGAVETYQEVGYSLQETCRRVSEKFNLPLQRAEEESKRYWKQHKNRTRSAAEKAFWYGFL